MPSRVKFVLGLVAFTIVLRIIPYVLTNYDIQHDSDSYFYPWNFSPLTALGLYSGAFLADRRMRYGLPLLALLISDLGIWAVTGQFTWAFPCDRWSAYLCIAVTVALGQYLHRLSGVQRVVAAVGQGVLAEVLFFLVTNFAYFCVQSDFPHTAEGLVNCYIAAIPFAKDSFSSTIFYSFLLFTPLAQRAAQESRVVAQVEETALNTIRSV